MAQQYQILDFDQANPGLTGASKVMSLADQMQKLREQGVAAQYQRPTLDEALKQARLQNQITANTAQYAPDLSQAELQQQQVLAKYAEPMAEEGLTNKQLENIISGINAQYAPEVAKANLESTRAKTQWLPYQALGQYAGGMGKLGQAQYYQNNPISLMRALQSPEFMSLYSSNPDVAAATNKALANVAYKASGISPSQGMPSIPNPVIPNPSLGQAISSPGMNINISPQDIQQSQLATADVLTRKRTPSQILNQQYYGNILDSLFTEGSKLMPSVSQYAGIVGKGKKGLEGIEAAFGTNSPQYTDYRNFTQFVAPSVANEMRRVLSGQATDTEMKLLSNIADPSYWDSNPQLAMKQWNYLQNLYRHSVGGALARTPSQAQTGLKQAATTPQYSQEDLEYTAKKYGMSIDEVKRKLGAQ